MPPAKSDIPNTVQSVADDFIGGRLSFFDAANQIFSAYTGSKTNFFDGFGLTRDLRFVALDTLQLRSLQLMRENPYAAAVFGRMEVHVVNAGMQLSPSPSYDVLAPYTDEAGLQEWATRTAELFRIWGEDKRLVTVTRDMTFNQLQRKVFRAAMCSGDCLVVFGVSDMGLPVIDVVDGINVRNDYAIASPEGNPIEHGVETDKTTGQVVAYYVENEKDILKMPTRVPVYRGGIRTAWLVKISDGRIGEHRGLPLLSVVMQNINELGKYLDSEQRAALVNSYIAMVHTRAPKQAPVGNVLKGAIVGEATVTDDNGTGTFRRMQPGFFATNLNNGETIQPFDTKRPNTSFAPFVENCLKTISFGLGIPPELLMLTFNSNYSASAQAINEMANHTKQAQSIFVASFLQPIYHQWLTGMILSGKIRAENYVATMHDPRYFDIVGAWRSAQWIGLPKSELSVERMVNALAVAEDRNWTNAKDTAKQYFGTDIETNIRINDKYRKDPAAAASGAPVTDEKKALADMTMKLDSLIKMMEERTA